MALGDVLFEETWSELKYYRLPLYINEERKQKKVM